VSSPGACANVDFGGLPSTPPLPGEARLTTPNPEGVTPVDVFIFILALSNIETSTNSFRFEGYGGLIWCDPRVAFDRDDAGSDQRIVEGEGVRAALSDIWWPGVFVPLQLGQPELLAERLVIYADGTVHFSGKFSTRVVADYDFTDFPLDRQTLRIPIQARLWQTDKLVLQPAHERVGFNEGFRIPEWDFRGFRAEVETLPSSGGGSFSQFVLEIEIGRRVGFYLWKILLPILIIVSISWASFWQTRDALAQRQRLVSTSLLTAVAYQFVAASNIPRVSYLTLMDAAMLWTFLTIAVTMVLNVRSSRLFRSDQEAALRMDRRWRWLYPLVYLVGLLVIASIKYLR
jgi:hypothetical protein